MESQPKNPEFRNNPEKFHPWSQIKHYTIRPSYIIFNQYFPVFHYFVYNKV